MDRHCATRRLHNLARTAIVRLPRLHPHLLRHTYVTTMLELAWTCATCRSPPDTPTPHHHARYDRARKNLDRYPNYILAAYMASAT